MLLLAIIELVNGLGHLLLNILYPSSTKCRAIGKEIISYIDLYDSRWCPQNSNMLRSVIGLLFDQLALKNGGADFRTPNLKIYTASNCPNLNM